MAKKKHPEVTVEEKGETVCAKALLFELENVAVKGRGLVYDVLSGILEGKGLEFSHGMFCKHCLYPPVKHFIPQILSLNKSRLSEDKLGAELCEAIKLIFMDSNLKMESGVDAMLDKAIGEGAMIGALSLFDEGTAGRIIDKLGLSSKVASVLTNGSEDKHIPGIDSWLKLARNMKIPAGCCVVVASSARACKAALSAGMQCAVLPDKYTSFQDFSGADLVLDSLSDDAMESILALFDRC